MSVYVAVIVAALALSAAGAADNPQAWLRVGPLGDVPKSEHADLPLSDQANAGGWQRNDDVWDDFGEDSLDLKKWFPGNHWWLGRQPAWFDPHNAVVADHSLQLTMRRDEPAAMPKGKGYHTYTSASVMSEKNVQYGYYEVRARPMNSAGSSSFWFQTAPWDAPKGVDGPIGNEIDVFELGGAAKGMERKLNITLHGSKPVDGKRQHFGVGAVYLTPWNLVDDFHVYGLEWNEQRITVYLDGVPVRWVENTCWHWPMRLIFDSETMPEWMGMPKDPDLPSTFRVDYVHAWRKGDGGAK
jgi:beta-glucanase (GH16 family)